MNGDSSDQTRFTEDWQPRRNAEKRSCHLTTLGEYARALSAARRESDSHSQSISPEPDATKICPSLSTAPTSPRTPAVDSASRPFELFGSDDGGLFASVPIRASQNRISDTAEQVQSVVDSSSMIAGNLSGAKKPEYLIPGSCLARFSFFPPLIVTKHLVTRRDQLEHRPGYGIRWQACDNFSFASAESLNFSALLQSRRDRALLTTILTPETSTLAEKIHHASYVVKIEARCEPSKMVDALLASLSRSDIEREEDNLTKIHFVFLWSTILVFAKSPFQAETSVQTVVKVLRDSGLTFSVSKRESWWKDPAEEGVSAGFGYWANVAETFQDRLIRRFVTSCTWEHDFSEETGEIGTALGDPEREDSGVGLHEWL